MEVKAHAEIFSYEYLVTKQQFPVFAASEGPYKAAIEEVMAEAEDVIQRFHRLRIIKHRETMQTRKFVLHHVRVLKLVEVAAPRVVEKLSPQRLELVWKIIKTSEPYLHGTQKSP